MIDYRPTNTRHTLGSKPGLTEREAERSRRMHGENVMTRSKKKSFWRQLVENLGDPVIRILLGALAVKLLAMLIMGERDIAETVGIAVAVLLAALISTLSEYSSARAFDRLAEGSMGTLCRVRRDGTVRALPIGELVVGDVILLGAGELIPADALLLSGELTSDQSAMTGEAREIAKYPSDDTRLDPASPSALLRGCTVTSGSGEAEIRAVGDHSFLGQISREIQADPRQSPLKLRLTRLAKQISRLGYLAALLVAFAYLFNAFVLDSGMRSEVILLKLRDGGYLFEQLFHALTLALTVLVVAVPEGLPMMIAVVLSANVRRMLRDNVLVRKPAGIEAAGSMNLLFTDKTGTLTEGRMRAVASICADGSEEPPDAVLGRNDLRAVLLSAAFRLGSDAVVGTDANRRPTALGGNATDRALLDCAIDFPPPDHYRVCDRLAFDSRRKYTAVSLIGEGRETLLVGAPERLLPHTRYGIFADGKEHPLNRSAVEACLRNHTQRGERVVAIARSCEAIPASQHTESIKGTLTLIALFCLSDPLREEARQSVASLQGAGVHVVMITGDSPDTARTLAKRCGILNRERDLVLGGDELARLSDARVCELLPRLAVVARALPTDKSRLVRLAGEMGLVTGMTGDGINDAPALRRADVGFAMGGGTQVAKDAGDVVILDNNLSSIVRAVLYGRTVFKSIRKFITLQLIMNLCAVGVTMICPFLGIDSPVTVVQMLWINLIMDTLGGLAFAGESPLPHYMCEPPKRRDEPILCRYVVGEILWLGGFTLCLCLFFLKSPTVSAVFRPSPDRIYHLTAFFALFIFSSVFNCFNARTDRLRLYSGLGKNPIFIVIMVLILVIQIGFIYLGGTLLRTAPLIAKELLVTLALALSVFPADILRKAFLRLLGRRLGY